MKRLVSAAPGFALVLLLASSALATPGARDLSFDDDGRATVDFGTGYEGGQAVAVGADGSILIVGGIDPGGPTESLAMARLTSSGEPDLTFSGDGQQIVESIAYGSGVALQEDGKIVVVAPGAAFESSFGWTIARFKRDGTPDSTFGGNGIVTTDLNPNEIDAPLDVVIQPDGKIVVVGFKGLSDGWRFAVARYEADGDLDPVFGNSGVRIVGIGLASRATAVALRPNGKIVVVGHAQKGEEIHSGVARFLSNGSLDPTFSGDGKLITRFGVVDRASDVAVQSDGGIVVVGAAAPAGGNEIDFGVARFRPDGRPDPNFSGDGLVRTDFRGEGDWAQSVAIQANGAIVVGGYAFANQRSNFAIARYSAAGRLNLSFGNQGRVRTNFGTGVDDYAFDIAIDSVGLVAVGWGTPIAGYDAAVARYLLS